MFSMHLRKIRECRIVRHSLTKNTSYSYSHSSGYQDVLQADWHDVWHSPHPPCFIVSFNTRLLIVLICFTTIPPSYIQIISYYIMYKCYFQSFILKICSDNHSSFKSLFTIFMYFALNTATFLIFLHKLLFYIIKICYVFIGDYYVYI